MSEEPATYDADEGAKLGEEFGRELSARTVLFHQAVAERLGIGTTDHKCLDIAARASAAQPITAGQLAELTGLTTGAITGVLDRLEKAGFIRREKHPHDRRQVVVRIVDTRANELEEIFAPFSQAWQNLYRTYSAAERDVVRRFMRDAARLLDEQTERVRRRPAVAMREPVPTASVSSSPLGRVEEGRLDFARGAVMVRIGAVDPDEELLYRARFDRSPPRITVEGGELTVFQKHPFMGGILGGEMSEMLVSDRIPWTLRLRGASKVEADLRRLRIAGVDVQGGASETSVQLPAPAGTVRIGFTGGCSKVRVTVPTGVPFRFVARGGASQLTINRLQLGAVGGEVKWESPDWGTARNRYDVELRGGASDVSILAE